jgi:hypothetical protein
MKERIATHLTATHNVVMLAALLGIGLTGSVGTSPAPTSDTQAQRVQAGKVASPVQVAIATNASAARFPLKFNPTEYYDQLRAKLNWLPVRYAGNILKTPDSESRLLLAQSAAKRAGLEQVGLSYKDVYGIIRAETSWIPRLGASKVGSPNLGLAQFEPATAKAVGLTDPSDPVQAVHAAALHLRDAAVWSAKRIASLKLTPEERAIKLREGVSIYYNLSSRGRSAWNGKNTGKLPRETQLHIYNARLGAREAGLLEAELRPANEGPRESPMLMTASSGEVAASR